MTASFHTAISSGVGPGRVKLQLAARGACGSAEGKVVCDTSAWQGCTRCTAERVVNCGVTRKRHPQASPASVTRERHSQASPAAPVMQPSSAVTTLLVSMSPEPVQSMTSRTCICCVCI